MTAAIDIHILAFDVAGMAADVLNGESFEPAVPAMAEGAGTWPLG
jgi:hypothetical protein